MVLSEILGNWTFTESWVAPDTRNPEYSIFAILGGMFSWEVDARPNRFRNVKERERHRKLQRSFQASRQQNYKKSGHPVWYGAYLKTAHWQRFKERYRKSGRPRYCTICGEGRYEIHHRTYERVGQEKLDDVIALCRTHHLLAHKREREGVPLWDAHLGSIA